jgi:hypothetical protein
MELGVATLRATRGGAIPCTICGPEEILLVGAGEVTQKVEAAGRALSCHPR